MAAVEGQPYKLCFAEKHRKRVTELAERAVALGIGEQYLAAIRWIEDRLRKEPLTWGEPQHRLHKLDLLVCLGIHWMLSVHYAVDEQRRIVYVKDISPLPSQPLAEGD